MKKVLSLLMAFVFVHVQSWAAVGGPFDAPPGEIQSYTGSYAGVLIPQAVEEGEGVDANNSSAIGLFSLAQPDVGPATGALVAFINGAAFLGSITGIIDPDDSSFRGVVDAQSTFNVTFFIPEVQIVNGNPITTFSREEFPVFAQGTVEAEIDFRTPSATTITSAGAVTTNYPARLEGTATLDVFFEIADNGTPIITTSTVFELDGFKQSDTATASTFGTFGQNFQLGGTDNGGGGGGE